MMPGGNAASSWRPNAPQLGNTSFSLNSLEIPGFQSSQSHTKTLNQLKSMQGVQGQVATQVRGTYAHKVADVVILMLNINVESSLARI